MKIHFKKLWKNFWEILENFDENNGVFTGFFTCRHIACEDAERAVYSQLCLHITGEYNRH